MYVKNHLKIDHLNNPEKDLETKTDLFVMDANHWVWKWKNIEMCPKKVISSEAWGWTHHALRLIVLETDLLIYTRERMNEAMW